MIIRLEISQKMKNPLIHLIPSKNIRMKYKKNYEIQNHIKKIYKSISGKNNIINGNITIKHNIKIIGDNNTINLGSMNSDSNLDIRIYGQYNVINLGKLKEFYGKIIIGDKNNYVEGCYISIGDDTSSNGIEIRLLEDKSKVAIGKDCMFSDDIRLYCTDFHCIVDNLGKLLNPAKSIIIGDHVWLAHHVSILKNTKIADNSIIGLGSVVTKSFTQSNVIIAGSPAKIVKTNVNWNRKSPKEYTQDKE